MQNGAENTQIVIESETQDFALHATGFVLVLLQSNIAWYNNFTGKA